MTIKKLLFTFYILFIPVLIGCARPTSDTVSDIDNITHCPKEWTNELNMRKGCKTDNLAGFKSNTCYKNGQKNGLSCTYSEKGTLINETYWKDDNKDGIDIDYFDNGNIQ